MEADGLLDLEYDRTIVKFQVQPTTVTLKVDGKDLKYTPDARLWRHTCVLGYREFKHSDSPPDAQLARKLEAAGALFRSDGYEFEVVESNKLRRGFRMDNLRTLHRYCRWPVSHALRSKVEQDLQAASQKTLGDLQQLVGPAGLGGLYRMLWDQEVGVELEAAPLCGSTAVWSVTT